VTDDYKTPSEMSNWETFCWVIKKPRWAITHPNCLLPFELYWWLRHPVRSLHVFFSPAMRLKEYKLKEIHAAYSDGVIGYEQFDEALNEMFRS
jgi:hypothetical protein